MTTNTKITASQMPEIHGAILASVERTLSKSSALDPTQVRLISIEVVRNIASDIGGVECYIPKSVVAINTNERYDALWNDFTGHNHPALAVKYGMSIAWVYQCIARIREAKNQ